MIDELKDQQGILKLWLMSRLERCWQRLVNKPMPILRES